MGPNGVKTGVEGLGSLSLPGIRKASQERDDRAIKTRLLRKRLRFVMINVT